MRSREPGADATIENWKVLLSVCTDMQAGKMLGNEAHLFHRLLRDDFAITLAAVAWMFDTFFTKQALPCVHTITSRLALLGQK